MHWSTSEDKISHFENDIHNKLIDTTVEQYLLKSFVEKIIQEKLGYRNVPSYFNKKKKKELIVVWLFVEEEIYVSVNWLNKYINLDDNLNI